MRTQITRLDVAARRRSLLAYSLGMAVYTLVVVALYPAFKDSTSLDKFIHDDPTGAALFGVSGTITSPDGWLNGNIYANFLPLVMLLVTVGYGAAALAGQDEDGTLSLIANAPDQGDVVVMEKAAAMVVQAVDSGCRGRSVRRRRTLVRSHDPSDNIVASALAVAVLGVDFGLDHDGRRRPDRSARDSDGGRRGRGGGLLPGQLARASRLVDPAASTVALLLVGREQPDHDRRHDRGLRRPACGRALRAVRGDPHVPASRPALIAMRVPATTSQTRRVSTVVGLQR